MTPIFRRYLSGALCATALLLVACGKKPDTSPTPPQPKQVKHLSITVVPDLSNRINPGIYRHAVTDQQVLEALVDHFRKVPAYYRRTMNQKDRLQVRMINAKLEPFWGPLKEQMQLDLGAFGTKQGERIKYINGTAAKNLASDQQAFKEAYGQLYANVGKNYVGADLWGFFDQNLDASFFGLSNPLNTPEVKDISRNVLILLTDGYLETKASAMTVASCEGDLCRYFSSRQLDKLRKYMKDNGLSDVKQAVAQSGIGILPVDNQALKGAEVLVLQVYDRSKDRRTGTLTKHPSDFKLLQAVWEDFLLKSGAAKVAVYETPQSVNQVQHQLEEFLKP